MQLVSSFLIPLCLFTVVRAQPSTPGTLREAAGERLLIGSAIISFHLDEPEHARLLAEQFSSITPGNEMKPDALQNVKGKFTFERADKIAAFAQQHNQKLIGHTLVWHHQSPKWLYQDSQGNPLPREEALENMRVHITTVMQHFKGRVYGYDVVNEGIADEGEYLRDTPARRAIGDDYIIKAFQFAHEADPDAQLYYNDYNIEAPYKHPKAIRLIKELLAAGCRVDAVGIQGHWMMESPKIEEVEQAVAAFRALGPSVMFTEVDVDVLPRRARGAEISDVEKAGLDPYKAGLPPEVAQAQAKRYEALFRAMLKHPGAVSRITFWGSTDANTWLNDWPTPGRTNHPMLWDRQGKPKPAFDAVLKVLAEEAK